MVPTMGPNGGNGWTGGINTRLCVLSVRQGLEGLGIAGAASLALVLSVFLSLFKLGLYIGFHFTISFHNYFSFLILSVIIF